MSKRILAIICTLVLMLTLVPVVAMAEEDTGVVYSVPTFEELKLTDDGQYVNKYGVQRMTWNNPAYGNFAGTTMKINGAVLEIRGGATAKGFQLSPDYANVMKFQGTVGVEYKLVLVAAAASTAGVINLVPDNHDKGVAKTFDLPAEKTTFELRWVQQQHEHNNLQISSDVDFDIYSITIYDAALLPEEPAEEEPAVEEPAVEEPAVDEPAELITISDPESFGGAFVNTTMLEVGKAYKIEYKITTTSGSNGGFRVRYCTDMGEGGSFEHNDTNNSAHSSTTAQASGLVANQVPAQFPNDTVSEGQTFTLTVNFTLGANIADLDPLSMDYIGLFGSQGNGAYIVNAVTVYDAAGAVVGTAGDEAPVVVAPPVAEVTAPPVVVTAPPAVVTAPPAVVTQPPAVVTAAPTEKPIDNNKTGVESFLFLALGLLAVTAAGAVFFVKKSQSK